MKHLLLFLLFAAASVGSLLAQESVIIKEPSEQCYQDLKANLPEAVRWDDSQHLVLSRPLATKVTGNVQLFARVFPEASDTKCKLVVGFDSPEHQAALNNVNSGFLFRNAHLLAARIETARKAREKDEKKKQKEQQQDKK